MAIAGKKYPSRGFGSMSKAKVREIASKGGKAAHEQGTAHEWDAIEAREAGKKGGQATKQRLPAPRADEPDGDEG